MSPSPTCGEARSIPPARSRPAPLALNMSLRGASILAVLLVGLVAAASAGAGSGSGSRGAATGAGTLRADVAEWSIVPSAGVIRAGRVKIVVRNLGEEPHELIVARTSSFAGALRIGGDRARVHPLAAPLVLAPGDTRTLVVSLRRGSYLLLDNLPWHYWKGTSVAFAVR